MVSLEGKDLKKRREESRQASSQTLLPTIDALLKDSKLSLGDIAQIKVHTGPGSYTGLRVGVAIANALGKLLGIPVNGVKDTYIEPRYSSER